MCTAHFSLPALTLGVLVHFTPSYFLFLELRMHWGKGSGIGWVGRPHRPWLLLKVSFKHPWTLPWTPGSHRRLNRSTEGSEAHPKPECHREPLHFRWLDSQLDRRCQPSGGGRRASDPSFLSESGEAQTQGTPFFLYEKIRSGNIIGKTIVSILLLLLLFSHVQISELKWFFTQCSKWLVCDMEQS